RFRVGAHVDDPDRVALQLEYRYADAHRALNLDSDKVAGRGRDVLAGLVVELIEPAVAADAASAAARYVGGYDQRSQHQLRVYVHPFPGRIIGGVEIEVPAVAASPAHAVGRCGSSRSGHDGYVLLDQAVCRVAQVAVDLVAVVMRRDLEGVQRVLPGVGAGRRLGGRIGQVGQTQIAAGAHIQDLVC